MGKYDKFRKISRDDITSNTTPDKLETLDREREMAENAELKARLMDYDWATHSQTARLFRPEPETFIGRDENRKLRMLRNLSAACLSCTMCELGFREAQRGVEVRDPHVFSNLCPSKFMVIGQNPGWGEVKARQPFVGSSGANFDREIIKYGCTREDFYICNTVRCYTPQNSRPNDEHCERCEPFLKMEIQTLKPKLLITLGSVAFAQLCPDGIFQKALGKISQSKYGVPVFAIYHPSPLNLSDAARKEAFVKQIKLMCGLVKRLRARKIECREK